MLSLPGRTGDTVRGYTADLLIIDEAARVSDELYAAIRPMLATTDGRLLTLSTPAGRRGWWFEAWENSGPTWERYEVPASAVPRIGSHFLEEERLALPAWIYRSEYECSFEDLEDALFGYELVQSSITDEVTPLFGELGEAS